MGFDYVQAIVSLPTPKRREAPGNTRGLSISLLVGGHAVTPESEGRKGLCNFMDLDGVVRCFDLHARFQPDPGRIHFRRVATGGEGRLRIAYIGRKLGA